MISDYLIRARLLSMTLQRKVQQPRLTNGSKISPFLSKHPGYKHQTCNQLFDCTTLCLEVPTMPGNM